MSGAQPSATERAARRRVIERVGARVIFAEVRRLVPCSQCGGEFPERHPDDFGFSHCENHQSAPQRAAEERS